LTSQLLAKLLIRKGNGNATKNAGHPRGIGSREARIPIGHHFPLVLDNNQAEAHEAFCILRSRLLNVQKKLGTRSVLITSAEMGDGKTLVASNLALSFGQLGRKSILLVDGDLRGAATTRLFNLKQMPGVCDFLQEDRPPESVIYPTAFPMLSVAPAGFVPQKGLPAILEGPRWRQFLEHAKEKFDLIVVDSSPASVPVADLELLAMPCDAYLVVVHLRQTHRDALKRIGSRLDLNKLLGVVLNNADETHNYYADYGSRSEDQHASAYQGHLAHSLSEDQV
jgi:capsular exopolysaccharide synthesis family protein